MKGFNGCAAPASARRSRWDISLQGKIRFPWLPSHPLPERLSLPCPGAAALPRPPSLRWGSLRASSDTQWVSGTLGSAAGLSRGWLASVPLGAGRGAQLLSEKSAPLPAVQQPISRAGKRHGWLFRSGTRLGARVGGFPQIGQSKRNFAHGLSTHFTSLSYEYLPSIFDLRRI